MIPIIKKIMGQKITNVSLGEYDHTGIGFEDGSSLTLQYPIIFDPGKDYKSILGDSLKDIEETDEEIALILHHQTIRINKKLDEGPEFMQLKVTGDDTIVVWNE